MRRGSAAAHPGRRNCRSSDPRQIVARRLAPSPRAELVDAGQRIDVGTHAYRQAHATRRRGLTRSGHLVRTRRRPCRRARRPRCAAAGHEADGRAIRDGSHDRRSARPQSRRKSIGLPLFLRHARRVRDHRGRCADVPGRVRHRHRCDRRCARAGRAGLRATLDIGQAIRAAPEVRNHAAAARAVRTRAALGRTVRPRAQARHRPHCRRRGNRAAGTIARNLCANPARWQPRRLERPRAGRAGLPEAGAPRHRLARDARARGWLAPASATGERRVLGQRNQARAGTRTRRLSGLHAQDAHRRVLPGLRAPYAKRARGALPDVRDAQCAHGLGDRGVRRRAIRGAHGLRVPATPRHGRRAVRRDRARPPSGRRLPRVRTRGPTQGIAALSRAAPPRERRQHVLRQSHRRCQHPGRRHRRRSGRARPLARCSAQPDAAAATRIVRTRARQFPRTLARRSAGDGRTRSRVRGASRHRMDGGADRRG